MPPICFALATLLAGMIYALVFSSYIIHTPQPQHLISKRPSFTIQKVVFYTTKGHLLACKRRPSACT